MKPKFADLSIHTLTFHNFYRKLFTLLGPTPTNISKNSDPDALRKGTFASPAVALASKVFPVPGGPVRRAPLGILAPNSLYL